MDFDLNRVSHLRREASMIRCGHAARTNIWIGTEGRGRNQHSRSMASLDLVLVFGCVVGSSGDGSLTPKQRPTKTNNENNVGSVNRKCSLAAKSVQTVESSRVCGASKLVGTQPQEPNHQCISL